MRLYTKDIEKINKKRGEHLESMYLLQSRQAGSCAWKAAFAGNLVPGLLFRGLN